MKKVLNVKNQQGIALFAVLMIILIFAIMGMMNAQKSKENERIAGGIVRYNTVFEAAERSLRDAGNYLLLINGIPKAGDGKTGRDVAKNFDVRNIERVNLSMNDNKTIVWDRSILSERFCAGAGCSAGINFVQYLDDSVWERFAIKSKFNDGCSSPSDTAGTKEMACDNYIRDVQTYTFIEQLRTNDGSGGGKGNNTSVQGSVGLTGTGYETYYLITVKASGFPPGTEKRDNPYNARENVILQGVFARR